MQRSLFRRISVIHCSVFCPEILKKPELDYYINEKKNAIAPKITDTGATTLQQQINDTFSSVASEAISEVISSSAGNLTVDVDQTNSELLQTIQDVRENLSGYQGVLTDFQDTVKQSDSLINDTVKTLDQVKDSVKSVSDTLNTSTDLLKESRLSTSSFATQISNSLSDGESFVNDAYINAAVKFGKLETQAEQIATSVSGSIDSVNELNQKNNRFWMNFPNCMTASVEILRFLQRLESKSQNCSSRIRNFHSFWIP